MHASFEAIFGLLMWLLDNETLHLHCTYNDMFIAANLCLARCCYRIKNDPQRTFGGEIKIGGGLLATQSASLEGVLTSVFSRFCPRKWQSKIECSQFSGFSSKNLIWLFNLSQNLNLTPQDFSLPQPKSSSNSVFLQFNWRYEFSQNCFHPCSNPM